MLHPRVRKLVALAVVLTTLTLALAGQDVLFRSGSSPSSSAAALELPTASAVPRSAHSHVAVVVMENRGYRQIIGSHRAPFTNALARRYALATHFFALTHPSLPNYLALATGSTFGVSRDCTNCAFDGPSLFTQLQQRGLSWKDYIAGVPSSCYLGSKAPGYKKALDPFAYLEQIALRPGRCRNLVPLARLGTDLKKGSLPDLAWITPSLCMDSHSCSIGTGDHFLTKLVPPLLHGLGPNGVLYVLWDEGVTNGGVGSASGGGHVPALIIGPGVRHGVRVNAPLNTYAALRTFEASFGLPGLGHARAANSDALARAFKRDLV